MPSVHHLPRGQPKGTSMAESAGLVGTRRKSSAAGSPAYAAAPDLTDEFEVKLLRPPKRLGFGYAANEAALLHKDSKTLALTDAPRDRKVDEVVGGVAAAFGLGAMPPSQGKASACAAE